MRVENLYSVLLSLLLLFLNCEGCMEEEREALLQIKSSINSPEGTAFSSWYGQDCCKWEGVECDVSTYLVKKIFFQYRRREKISQEKWYPNATLFAQFKGLEELYLPGNQIEGFISPNELQKLKNLRRLDLRDNSITTGSDFCWANMSSLESLYLSRNNLRGNIPKCLCESQSISVLELSHNQLNGMITACFSNGTSLKHLDLSDNLFTGKFHSLLFHNLTNIESFIASRNHFKDMISFSVFTKLSKLSHLDISYNPGLEIDTESPIWSPSFKLNHLNLAGCNLKTIPSFISTQYHLQYLDLSYNSLVGSIPASLFCNVSSELWIRGNNLSGSFPLCPKNMSSHLYVLDISDNLLHGPLPADINSIFPAISHLNASMNNFGGSLPKSFGAMMQLQTLDLSYNGFEGEISHSITSNMTSLEYLKLSGNKLNGEALPRNSSWPKPNLRWLFLEENHFSELSFDSLSAYSSLLMLIIHNNDLTGELSTNFPVLPQLRVLVLRQNLFEGQIPVQLCQIKHLRLLDLSQNALSGEVPTCLDNNTSWTDEGSFSDDFEAYASPATIDFTVKHYLFRFERKVLTHLYGIDVSSNKLTGTIPHQMSKLIRVVALNLSNNLLTGEIPASFGNLNDMQSLDLSHNKLYGGLPRNLTDVLFLEVFNVSFNNLSGPIPMGKQFSTFDNSSYLGNPNLCGSPVTRTCNQLVEGRPLNLCSNKATTSTLILWCTVLFFVEIVY